MNTVCDLVLVNITSALALHTTDHTIQIIQDRIRSAWGKLTEQVVSMLFLDVSGAYDNVAHPRLIHNLRRRRLGWFVPWIQAFLTNRSTRIRMPEGVSNRIPTPTGIPQGSPISPILYLIYNADLIELCNTTGQRTRKSFGYGWVDDAGAMVIGRTEAETTRKLQQICGLAQQWARRHASVFDVKKYGLIHFVGLSAHLSTRRFDLVR
jgi:hypothetical protein